MFSRIRARRATGRDTWVVEAMTPELIQEVNLINGPFSAEYGDFSGLGVVHIRLRESLAGRITARIQGGSFGTTRAFLAVSPQMTRADGFLAWEGSRTDGPFVDALAYARNNVTANYTRRLSDSRALGFKFNGGLNRYNSSGQIPLDEVAAGHLIGLGRSTRRMAVCTGRVPQGCTIARTMARMCSRPTRFSPDRCGICIRTLRFS